MKKKINLQFLITVGMAIILTAVLAVAFFYYFFKNETFSNLKAYAKTLQIAHVNYDEITGIRITVIDRDGNVNYDSDADVATIGNLANRPEVSDALTEGEGKIVERSKKFGQNTFYYAMLTEDGNILRVSKDARNIVSMLAFASPWIIAVMSVAFGVCFILNHFLTKSFIAPIKEVANNLDNLDDVTVYRELKPFVTVIKKQHEDIVRNAMVRQEFTANVSHELKTPLTAISGYSELIETGLAGGEDITRFAGEIHHSAQRLLSLINDILELSELDAGKADIEFTDVDLYDVAKNTLEMLELKAQKHGITMHLEGEQTIIRADRIKIEEVVNNLCDNSIRYNEPGGNVWVRVVNGSEKILIVSDDGIGIPEEKRQRIFERFFRVDKSRSKKTGGTGLGLAIVKHIVEQHNAVIEVYGREGAGTTIKVRFK